MAKENLQTNEQIAQLNARRVLVDDTLYAVQTGDGLPGHLQFKFLDHGLSDLYDKMVIANEAAIKPLLEQEKADIEKQINKLLRKTV